MSCCNSTTAANAAIITPVLAAGSTEPPYFFQVNISQRLCRKTCINRTPMFQPVFSLVSWSSVGTGQYVATISVAGVINYIPCDGGECCTQAQLVSQVFSVPFASATAPTSVTVTAGTPVSAVYAPACKTCGRAFVSEVPITLNVA